MVQHTLGCAALSQLLCSAVDQAGRNGPFGPVYPAGLFRQKRLAGVKTLWVVGHTKVGSGHAGRVLGSVLPVRMLQSTPVPAALRVNAVTQRAAFFLQQSQRLHFKGFIGYVGV